MSNSEKLYQDSEEYKKVKNEINEEGFEDSGGTGDYPSAVIIGSKEERDRIAKLLKKDEPTVDLETYLRLHKEIIGTKEEIEQLKDDYDFQASRPGIAIITNENLLFKDSKGNLAKVNLTHQKYINSDHLEKDLNVLGFCFYNYYAWGELEKKLERMKQRKFEQEKQDNFDF